MHYEGLLKDRTAAVSDLIIFFDLAAVAFVGGRQLLAHAEVLRPWTVALNCAPVAQGVPPDKCTRSLLSIGALSGDMLFKKKYTCRYTQPLERRCMAASD